MKLCAWLIEKFTDFVSKGFFRPSGEPRPVILGLFPKDLDQIELQAVRGKVARESFEFFHPSQGETIVQAMMDAGFDKKFHIRYA